MIIFGLRCSQSTESSAYVFGEYRTSLLWVRVAWVKTKARTMRCISFRIGRQHFSYQHIPDCHDPELNSLPLIVRAFDPEE